MEKFHGTVERCYLGSISDRLKSAGFPESMTLNFIDIVRDVAKEVSDSNLVGALIDLDRSLAKSVKEMDFDKWCLNEFEFRSFCYNALGHERKQHREPLNHRFYGGYFYGTNVDMCYTLRDHQVIGESLRRIKAPRHSLKLSVEQSEFRYHGKRHH